MWCEAKHVSFRALDPALTAYILPSVLAGLDSHQIGALTSAFVSTCLCVHLLLLRQVRDVVRVLVSVTAQAQAQAVLCAWFVNSL